MILHKTLFFGFILFIIPIGSTIEVRKFKHSTGNIGHYYLDKSNVQGSYSLILLLQGSEITTVYNLMDLAEKKDLTKLNAAVLGIEKQGVTQNTFNKNMYLASNSLWQRAQDCIDVVGQLHTSEPEWNGKLIIIGISEGATLAAYTTPLIKETVATIMFSGGCGMTLYEEIQLLENRRVCTGCIDKLTKYYAQISVYAMLSLAKWLPNSAYTCIGDYNTLKYWNTIGTYNPLTSLEKLNIPLYIAHGTHDTNCPLESAQKLVAHFKKIRKENLTHRFFEGYDHSFNDTHGKNHLQEVTDQALVWVQTVLESDKNTTPNSN